MKLTDLKKELASKESRELIALICKLYRGSKQAQSIIDIELCGNTAELQLVSDCKKKIDAAFFGNRLFLKNAKAVISEFKKASKSKENIADLLLFYVECGVEYTNMHGDIDAAFYYSIETVFSDFVNLINTLDTSDFYVHNAARIRKVYDDSDCIGWGFHEEISTIYCDIVWREDDE